MNILYGSIISPFVRKVFIVLNIKHIAHENIELIPFIESQKQKLLSLHPLGKVPIYQENDFVIADSSVICAYLEKKHPEHPIYPTQAESYARCLWYEEYADFQLIPTLSFVFFHTLLAEKFNRQPDIEGIKLTLDTKIPPAFDYLDKEIGSKNYLVDEHFSLADISIVSAFFNFKLAGFDVDAKQWKNLARYIETISQEKPIQAAFKQAKDKLIALGMISSS